MNKAVRNKKLLKRILVTLIDSFQMKRMTLAGSHGIVLGFVRILCFSAYSCSKDMVALVGYPTGPDNLTVGLQGERIEEEHHYPALWTGALELSIGSGIDLEPPRQPASYTIISLCDDQ